MQVQQEFYVNDFKLGKDCRIVKRMQPQNLYNIQLFGNVLHDDGEPYQQDDCTSQHNNIYEDEDEALLLHRNEIENILVDVEFDESSEHEIDVEDDKNNVTDDNDLN